LVTGAGGSIGSALAYRLMGGLADTLVLLDHSEHNLHDLYRRYQERHITLPKIEFVQGDILCGARLQEIFTRYRPHVVFHAAAMKHVAALESDPFSALENNVVGTVRLLEIADSSEVEIFVNVSTDKAVNPTSILGVSKRISELLLVAMESSEARWISLRLGNVLGSSGSVVPLFLQSLEEQQPLNITDPRASRYFLTLEETVAFLMKSLEISGSSLLLPEMGSQQSVMELADFLLRQFSNDSCNKLLNFTGLKDGEKCTEQLAYDYEYLTDTPISHLYEICGTGISDPEGFADNLGRLLELVEHRENAGFVEALYAVVPEFCPSPTFLRYVH